MFQYLESKNQTKPETSDSPRMRERLNRFRKGAAWINKNWEKRFEPYVNDKIRQFERVIMPDLDRAARGEFKAMTAVCDCRKKDQITIYLEPGLDGVTFFGVCPKCKKRHSRRDDLS